MHSNNCSCKSCPKSQCMYIYIHILTSCCSYWMVICWDNWCMHACLMWWHFKCEYLNTFFVTVLNKFFDDRAASYKWNLLPTDTNLIFFVDEYMKHVFFFFLARDLAESEPYPYCTKKYRKILFAFFIDFHCLIKIPSQAVTVHLPLLLVITL